MTGTPGSCSLPSHFGCCEKVAGLRWCFLTPSSVPPRLARDGCYWSRLSSRSCTISVQTGSVREYEWVPWLYRPGKALELKTAILLQLTSTALSCGKPNLEDCHSPSLSHN